jgi:hypothetical protein
MCCQAPRGALCSPARTVYQDASPRSWCGWYARWVAGCPERRRSPGSRPLDTGRVRRAGGRLRYRRSRFRRSARAFAGATARRATVSEAAVRARGTDRLLPVRADLVARTVPLLFRSNRADRPGSQPKNLGDLPPTSKLNATLLIKQPSRRLLENIVVLALRLSYRITSSA